MEELWVATYVAGDETTWCDEELTALAGVTSPFGVVNNREEAKNLVRNHVARRIDEDGNPLMLSEWEDKKDFSTAQTSYVENDEEPEGFYGIVRIVR